MASEVSLVGKRASTTLQGFEGEQERVVEGPIIYSYVKEWNPLSGLDEFDPYERVVIDLTVPGSGVNSTVDVARTQITLLG